jgi:hypothetical protein
LRFLRQSFYANCQASRMFDQKSGQEQHYAADFEEDE